MDRVVELARARALAVNEASGQLGVANAAGVGARASSLGNPYLEVIAERSKYYDDVSINAQLFLPLEVSGARGARIEEANQLVQWRQIGLVSARASATGEALAAYGDTIVAAAQVALASKAEEDARKEAQFFSARLQAGDTTIYERSLADAEVARWTQTLAEAKVRVTQSLARLVQGVGVPVDDPPSDAAHLPPALRTAWDDAYVARVVDGAPGIAALKAEQGYWAASLDRAERDKWAPLQLIVTGGRGQLSEPVIGAGLGWSFPVTRRNQGEVARAEAERGRAATVEASYRKVLESRVRGAVAVLASIRATVDTLDKSGIPAAERVVDASSESFRLGKVELSRVLLARRDLATARARRLDLIGVAWRAYGDLAAVGGGLP